jgi:hypothetical protein
VHPLRPAGRYRIETLAATHGAQARLPDILTAIRLGSDCPHRTVDLTVRCQIRMPELLQPGAVQ